MIYRVNNDNLIKIEEYIEIKGYVDYSKIVFILEVPLIDKDTYIFYKVIPIPVYNSFTQRTTLIIPEYPYLIVKGMKYRPVASSCEEINHSTYLCAEDNIVQYPVETCIEQLMLLKNNFSKCQQQVVQIEKTRVQPITDKHWMVYAEENIIVIENCSEETRKYELQGTYILLPTQQCTIQIQDVYIANPTDTTSVVFNLSPMQMPELRRDVIVSSQPNKQMDLRGVDLGNIKDLINSIRNVDSDLNESYIISDRISVWTISIYVIIIIIVLIFIAYECNIHNKIFYRNSLKTTQLPSDNFSLGEGGVKSDEPVTISFVSNKYN